MSKWLNSFLQNSDGDADSKQLAPLFHQDFSNIPRQLTDNTDRPLDGKLVSVLSVDVALSEGKFVSSGLVHEFEERIAIAEYDGQQNTVQAQRIAYQDAFIIALTATTYEAAHEASDNWFSQLIKESQAWLISQGIPLPK